MNVTDLPAVSSLADQLTTANANIAACQAGQLNVYLSQTLLSGDDISAAVQPAVLAVLQARQQQILANLASYGVGPS